MLQRLSAKVLAASDLPAKPLGSGATTCLHVDVCSSMSGWPYSLLAACLAVTMLCLSWSASGVNVPAVSSQSTKITFDLAQGHPVEDKLWGVFFEEVNHCMICYAWHGKLC